MTTQQPRRVSYIWSQDAQDVADCLPANIGRSSVVHGLIQAFELLEQTSSKLNGSSETAKTATSRPKPNGTSLDPPYSSSTAERPRATIIAPALSSGIGDILRRYHDKEYVAYLLRQAMDRGSDSEDSSSTADSDDSLSTKGRPVKRRKAEKHGMEYDCPSFPELAEYAATITAGTLTACRQLIQDLADVAIYWDGGRHHTLRNRASGFCYVADIVLGIMMLAKEGKPFIPREQRKYATDGSPGETASLNDTEATKGKEDGQAVPWLGESLKKPPRRPRIMYLDLDIHYGDGVAQAFLSPTNYPSTSLKKPPRPPQTLTLSIHHTSRTFFPPSSSHINLPSPETPNPFTLSVPLSAYPSRHTIKTIWDTCVEPVRKAFDPDYIVVQLGMDGLPGDPVGQYGAWSIEGDGGVRWCIERMMEWDRPLCVLGGGGYVSHNAARAWTVATATLLGRDLLPETFIPDHQYFPLYQPSFDIDIAESTIPDENTDEELAEAARVFDHISKRIRDIIQAHT